MKTSIAILLVLQNEGGTMEFNKFDWFIGEMEKAGLIERKPDAFWLTLTEKGKEQLRRNLK